MTKLLEKAIAKVRRLPADGQDRIAAFVLGEIAALEARSDAPKAKTRLDALIAHADREIDEGKVGPLAFPRRR